VRKALMRRMDTKGTKGRRRGIGIHVWRRWDADEERNSQETRKGRGGER
jgi:hypothetical protein